MVPNIAVKITTLGISREELAVLPCGESEIPIKINGSTAKL
jgi:hypothetical protein